MLALVAQANPRPRIIVGFPTVPHDFVAIHQRSDTQRILLVGRGAFEEMKELAGGVTTPEEFDMAALGITVEFWNWTEHRDITRAIFQDLGYGPRALNPII